MAYEVQDPDTRALPINQNFNTQNAAKDLQDLKTKVESSHPLRWVFVGDSITQGVMHTKGLRHYTEYINQLLHDPANGLNRLSDRVVNSGNSSATTAILDNQTYKNALIIEKDPDIAFITYGMNDASGNKVPVNKFTDNLKAAVQTVRGAGAIPVVQTTNYTMNRDASLDPYYEAVRTVAKETGTILIDFAKRWKEILEDGNLNKSDLLGDANIHPSEKGHLEWAQYIANVLNLNQTPDGEATALSQLTADQIVVPAGNKAVHVTNAANACAANKQAPKVDSAQPMLNYDVNKFFGGTAHISKNSDVSKIANAAAYTLVTRVKADTNGGGTIFSISDKDSQKTVSMRLENKQVNKGKLQIAAPSLGTYWSRGNALTDGEWHTIAMAITGDTNSKVTIYVDGSAVSQANPLNLSGKNIGLPTLGVNSVTIGGTQNTGSGPDHFVGSIDFAQVYNKALTSDELQTITSEASDPAIDLNKYINNGTTPNTWLFLGSDTTAGLTNEYQVKNYTEIFEEALRWEYSKNNMDQRMKQLVNDGQDGFTSVQLLERYNVLTTSPADMADVVYIVPDVVKSGQLTENLSTFQTNIKTLAQKIQTAGNQTVLVTPPNISPAAEPFAQAMKTIADEVQGTKLIDLHKYLVETNSIANIDSWFDTDGIANDAGQLAIGRYLLEKSGLPLKTGKDMRLYALAYDHTSGSSVPAEVTIDPSLKISAERGSGEINNDASKVVTTNVKTSDLLAMGCFAFTGPLIITDVTDSNNPKPVPAGNVTTNDDGYLQIKDVDGEAHLFSISAMANNAAAGLPNTIAKFGEFEVLKIAKAENPTVFKGVTINAPQSKENEDFKVEIRLVNEPEDGVWNLNDEAEFRIILTNKTDSARAFDIMNQGQLTNLTHASGCKWYKAAPNVEQQCFAQGSSNKVIHRITAEDVKAGEFTPYARFQMHKSADYGSAVVSDLAAGPAPEVVLPEANSAITISNPKGEGEKWKEGDTIKFLITVTNDTGIDRAFKSVNSNLTNWDYCKWNNIPNGTTKKDCTGAYHVVTADDVAAGKFTPEIQWSYYPRTTHSTGTPILLAPTKGSDIPIVKTMLKVTSFEQTADSVKYRYTEDDELVFDVTISNVSDASIDLRPAAKDGNKTNVDGAESCVATDLAPGKSVTCQVRYTVTKENLDDGESLPALDVQAVVNDEVVDHEQAVKEVNTQRMYRQATAYKPKDANPTNTANSSEMKVLAAGNSTFAYRIPAIVRASNGDLLAAYDARPKAGKTSGGDSPNENWIVMRRSIDNGVTWGEQTTVAKGVLGVRGYSDPSFVVDYTTGKIFNFHVYSQDQGFWKGKYTKKADGTVDEISRNTMNLGLSVSSDNGMTWDQRVVTQALVDKVPEIKSCFATSGAGTQKMHEPHKGRLLQQLGCEKSGGGVVAITMYSDDHGDTWQTGEYTSNSVDGNNFVFDENKVVELENGNLMLNSRTPNGSAKDYRIVAISKDGGDTWQDYKIEKQLSDSTNNAQIIRAFPNANPGTLRSKVLLFSNTPAGGRAKGVMSISYDNGQTWQKGSTIRSGGTGYTTMTIQSDGRIGLLLEPGGNGWADIGYMNFSLAWADPDHDVDSELKAKADIPDQRGTDGQKISIPLNDLFDHNDPVLKDTVKVTGISGDFALSEDGTSIEGIPNVGNKAVQTVAVTVKLTEAADGTGYPREAAAAFNLQLTANPNPSIDPPAVNPKHVTPSVSSNVQPHAEDPASCEVKPYAQLTPMEGVTYTAAVDGKTVNPDANGKIVYGYGQTLKVTASAQDGYVIPEGVIKSWEWTAPTRESLNCDPEPESGNPEDNPSGNASEPGEGEKPGTSGDAPEPGESEKPGTSGDAPEPGESEKPGTSGDAPEPGESEKPGTSGDAPEPGESEKPGTSGDAPEPGEGEKPKPNEETQPEQSADSKRPAADGPAAVQKGKSTNAVNLPATGADIAAAGLLALVLLGTGAAGIALRRRNMK
ncbi:GDSL-type esterase/lipase family protein [Arcanobacterium hippocoleae]